VIERVPWDDCERDVLDENGDPCPAVKRPTFVSDANGNQQIVKDASTRTTTGWDYENQPTRYNQPANVTYPIVTMTYNADNQRVRKESYS
jgi:hypothetical protein